MQEYYTFASDHLLLITAIIGVFILIILEELSAFSASKYQLEPEAAAIRIQKGARLLDVRNKESFNKTHIGNATWVKYEHLVNKPETLIDTNSTTILYCDSGTQSAELSEQLRKKHGFKIYFIEGGIQNWIDGGFQTTKGKKTNG